MELEKIYRGMENGAETIQENFATLSKVLYPVGSIFQSMINNDPTTIYGGTWEPIKGKVLVGVDNNDSDFVAGKKGGTKGHNHGLSKGYAQMQMTGSTLANNGISGVATYKATTRAVDFTALANTNEYNWGTQLAGSTDSSNNLPPYETVYIWVRTA